MRGIIERYFKVWGVKYETDLPPEFIVTSHAEQRLKERLKCHKDKMKKLVIKAWYSQDMPSYKVNRKKYNQQTVFKKKYKHLKYRELMGYVFVFAYGYDKREALPSQKVLITVF